MPNIQGFTLNNGVVMPSVGLGVYQSSPEDTAQAVSTALKLGYRLIDTAAAYGNEREVGEGIRNSGVAREDVFVTTKLWISDYGYDQALHAFDRSMGKLGLDTLDLYLLHWPMPNEWDRTLGAWKAAEKLLADGRTRAIGVCNFSPADLDRLAAETDIVPAVNQVELHPFFTQAPLRAAGERLGIVTQAWSPIGGVNRYMAENGKDPLTQAAVKAIADRYGKTPAQVILRWHLEHGVSVIPKSVHEARIRENFDLFGFALTPEDVAAIDALDTGTRGGPDPAEVDTQKFSFTIED